MFLAWICETATLKTVVRVTTLVAEKRCKQKGVWQPLSNVRTDGTNVGFLLGILHEVKADCRGCLGSLLLSLSS